MTVDEAVRLLDRWTRDDLTSLNRAILTGAESPEVLPARFRAEIAPHLPDPPDFAPVPARQAVVLLGLVGASVARYRQEAGAPPERSLAGLLPHLPFPEYFARVAERTGDGHPPRDSYTSLVRWNVPDTTVTCDGGPVAAIPGAFDDALVRSYTGTAGEASFFQLIKQGECLEQGVNAQLWPMAAGEVDLAGPEAEARLVTAAALLDTLRHLMSEFPHLPGPVRMTSDQFMDAFRQYAVHWRPGDLPPSGAMDTEAITRDFLLGMGYPGYDAGIRRLFPGLLAHERPELERVMAVRPLPEQLLDRIGAKPGDLAALDAAAGGALLVAHPELVPWFGLLQAHSRASSAHFGLTKRMLFNPQRAREAAAQAGKPVVDNSKGTTGMTERYLLELTRHRRHHVLADLHAAVVAQGAPRTAPPEVVVHVAGRGEHR